MRINIIIKSLSCLLIACFVLSHTIYGAPASPTVKADSAILVDALRGQILYQKSTSKKLHVSTACKIMTALIVIDKAKLDAKVTISKESTSNEKSNLNLEVGEKYTVENLLFAIILSSANDASNALAEYVGGDIEKFVVLMNNKAKALNMKNTNFTNPSGVYDQSQYTTAYDLALLIRHAVSIPAFNNIFSSKAITWESSGKTQLLVNSNKLFWSYDGVDGGKVGYNEKSLQSAITTATRDNMRLISIVLDTPENTVYTDSTSLFDYGFENYKSGILVSKGQVLKTTNIGDVSVNLISPSDIYYTYPIGDNYIKDIEFNITQKIELPVTKDKTLGTAKYILKDNITIDVELSSDKDIYPPSSLLNKIREKLTENKDIYMLVILLLSIEALLILLGLSKFIIKRFLKKQV